MTVSVAIVHVAIVMVLLFVSDSNSAVIGFINGVGTSMFISLVFL